MKASITYNKGNFAKASVIIHKQDLWDGSTTLAKVIYPFLKKYRNIYNNDNSWTGYPAEFGADPTRPEGPDNPDRFNEWLICLDKMVYSFGWLAKNEGREGPEFKNYIKECQKACKPYRKELKKLLIEDRKRFKALDKNGALNSLAFDKELEITKPIMDIYFKKFEEHHNKIQEGIDLFAKYYGSLWI